MSENWYPLARASVFHPETPRHGGRLELYGDADPALPLAPGQRFRLMLSITPQDEPFRVYGYVLPDLFEGVLGVVRHQGLAKMESGRYATYASGSEPRAVTMTVRVADDAPEGSYFLPRIVVGVKRTEKERLVASMANSHLGFRVRRHWLAGHVMLLEPGGGFTVPPDYSPLEGLRFTGSSFPARGTLFHQPGGGLTYQAAPDFLGYDSFSVEFEDGTGHRVRQEITVHVGGLGDSPGALPADA
ncbi:Ig-like domain-containing protein [Streptomyces bikiniensis]|uniref:Ig-like domain-containing protein n=1 Tax=Streptomyces bikiniensis TaxID=1896 RepID=A0ABW8D281_STRBI